MVVVALVVEHWMVVVVMVEGWMVVAAGVVEYWMVAVLMVESLVELVVVVAEAGVLVFLFWVVSELVVLELELAQLGNFAVSRWF